MCHDVLAPIQVLEWRAACTQLNGFVTLLEILILRTGASLLLAIFILKAGAQALAGAMSASTIESIGCGYFGTTLQAG
jgi:hypothetical protein